MPDGANRGQQEPGLEQARERAAAVWGLQKGAVTSPGGTTQIDREAALLSSPSIAYFLFAPNWKPEIKESTEMVQEDLGHRAVCGGAADAEGEMGHI